jgi:hypothetical protein
MSDLNKLENWYVQLLNSVDCKVDPMPDYTVKFYLNDAKEGHIDRPIILKDGGKDKELILPVKELIANIDDWDKVIAFHPACESVLGGQSTVLNFLVTMVAGKLIRTIRLHALSILELYRNEEIRESLTLAQRELLSQFSFDKSTHKLFTAVDNKTTLMVGEFPLLSLQLVRGGEIGGVQYLRTCKLIPHFLLIEDTICGCTPGSKGANLGIRKLLRYLLPDQLEYGVNIQEQPYLNALLETYRRAAIHLNFINSILGKYSLSTNISMDWWDDKGSVNEWFKLYLPKTLDGNVGKSLTAPEPTPARVVEGRVESEPEPVPVRVAENKRSVTDSLGGNYRELSQSRGRGRFTSTPVTTGTRDGRGTVVERQKPRTVAEAGLMYGSSQSNLREDRDRNDRGRGRGIDIDVSFGRRGKFR